MGLSFKISAGPCQHIHSRIRVPWDSRPYFTVPDSRLPFLSPPATSRATVEVFDTASNCLQDNSLALSPRKTPSCFVKDACLQLRCLAIEVLLFRAFAWLEPHGKHSFTYIVVTFLRGVFTSRRIETELLLLLPIFVAVRMFTDIPLLLLT
jgi:hypothetical protein